MANLIDSINKVVLLENRQDYVKSVSLGLQVAFVFMPLEILRRVLMPFIIGIGCFIHLLYSIFMDVLSGAGNVTKLFTCSIFYGFSGRLGTDESEG